MPFSWGSHDCMLWAANVIERLTGVDVARDYRGTYRTVTGAARILRHHDGTVYGMARDIARAYGLPMIPALEAQRGDIVCLPDGPLGDALGVCLGQYSVGPGERGLKRMDTALARCAWRV